MSSDGGDPACWLGEACPDCGYLDDGPVAPTCPRCGRDRRADDGVIVGGDERGDHEPNDEPDATSPP